MPNLAPNVVQQRFAVIADSVPVLIAYVDRNCVYQFVNKAYETWFSTTRAETVGRTVRDVVGPEAWERIRGFVRRSLEGELVQFETTLVYHKAGKRTVDVTYTPDLDPSGKPRGMVAFIRDISAQRKAEAALRKEHHYISTILSTTAALIVVLDPQGKIVHVNKAFEAATGSNIREIKGTAFIDKFLPEEDRPSVKDVFTSLVRTQAPSRHVNAICHLNGTTRLIEWSNNVVLADDGKVDLIIGTGLDITERRELEREILSISDAERYRVGEELHDNIGQRLTGLELFVHGVRGEMKKKSPSLEKHCEELSAELRAITREVRLLSHGLAPVSLQADSLQMALDQMVHSTKSRTGIDVRLDSLDDVKFPAPDIPIHLYRIAQEALNNALKHSKATIVTISLKKSRSDCVLTIADNGTGLCEKTRAGMGLRLMEHRAELIGGHLFFASVPGLGTTIQCILPL